MIKKFINNKLFISLALFILLNTTLYLFVIFFNNKIEFNKFNYFNNAHHYIVDTRITENRFDLLNAIGQFDAQWYLKIADIGYSQNPASPDLSNKSDLQAIDYAFFPVFPIVVSLLNILLHNILLSAFIVTNTLLIADFILLYLFVKEFYDENIAVKTTFLLFTFPFGLFYRSYFAESTFLLFLILFSYFLLKSKYIFLSLTLGILNFVKGNAILINFVFLYYFYNYLKSLHWGTKLKFIVLSSFFVITPLIFWLYYVNYQTGDYSFFVNVRSLLRPTEFPLQRFSDNILTILSFPNLSLHLFHSSKVDSAIAVVTFIILLFCRKKIPRKLWWVSFTLWLTPLMFSDLMSFSRYQSVSFPLFIYLSTALSTRIYKILLTMFTIGLFTVSLYFINWYWIG